MCGADDPAPALGAPAVEQATLLPDHPLRQRALFFYFYFLFLSEFYSIYLFYWCRRIPGNEDTTKTIHGLDLMVTFAGVRGDTGLLAASSGRR